MPKSVVRPFVLAGVGFGESSGPLFGGGVEVGPQGGRLGLRVAVEDYVARVSGFDLYGLGYSAGDCAGFPHGGNEYTAHQFTFRVGCGVPLIADPAIQIDRVKLSLRSGTSRKSARFRVHRAAPSWSAHAATARSISRPLGRLTAPYSRAASAACAGPKGTALSRGNNSSCTDSSARVAGP